MDSPYVHYYEKGWLERLLDDILSQIWNSDENGWSIALDQAIAHWRPYDQFYAIKNWFYCLQLIHFNFCMRSTRFLVLLVWQNEEIFESLPQKRGKVYVSRPLWYPPNDYCQLLSIFWLCSLQSILQLSWITRSVPPVSGIPCLGELCTSHSTLS